MRLTRTAGSAGPRFAALWLCLFAMLPATPALSAQPGPDGNRGHLHRLLHDRAVVDHLGLTSDQIQQARQISDSVVEGHRADFEKAMAIENRAERVPRVARIFVSINTETFDRLKPVIGAHQHQRLGQIELQTFGIRAFGRPEVADHLALTTAQRDDLKSLGERTGERLSGLHKSSALSAAEKSDSARDIRSGALREARQRLSAGQWVKWELLTGAAFAPREPAAR